MAIIFEDGGSQGQNVLPNPEGGSGGPLILAPSTNYLFRFIPSTTTNTTNFHIALSEHDGFSVG